MLYVCNVDEGFGRDRQRAVATGRGARQRGGRGLRRRSQRKIEAEIAPLPADEREHFLAELGLTEPGLDRLIRAGYDALAPRHLLHRRAEGGARLDRDDAARRAPQAAGVIHTDFEHGFIRAETIAYDDYVACGGEAGARDAGKMRLEGKDYVVADGDVMHFRFAT